MKYEITLEMIEEIAACIVDNQLDMDEAIDYAKECLLEFVDIEVIDEARH